MPFPSKRKLQSRAGVGEWRKKTQLNAPRPCDSEQPAFAESAISEIPEAAHLPPPAPHLPADSDSKETQINSDEQLPSGTSGDGCEGGMPGVWPEWSEVEDELQESETEEEQVAQIIGQPAAGWTETESLLGGGRILSENTRAIWARQDRAKRAAKVAGEKASSLLSTYGDISRFFITSASASQPELPPNFIPPNFDRSEGCDGNVGNDITGDIFQLEVWVRRNKPDLQSQWGQRIDSVLRLLRMQQARWKEEEELSLVEDSVKISEWKRSKRVEKRVEYFLLLFLLLFRPSTRLYKQCLLSVISAFSFHIPPAVARVFHFCPFTPQQPHCLLDYTMHTPVPHFNSQMHFFSTPSLTGALFNR